MVTLNLCSMDEISMETVEEAPTGQQVPAK
jgi:hypothetical protein